MIINLNFAFKLILLGIMTSMCFAENNNKVPSGITETQEKKILHSLSTTLPNAMDEKWERGCLLSQQDGQLIGVYWLSDIGRIGEGAIAVFNNKYEVIQVLKTKVLLDIKLIDCNGVAFVSYRFVSKSGTGLHQEALSIVPLNDIRLVAWSGVVRSLEQGPYPIEQMKHSEIELFESGPSLFISECISSIDKQANGQWGELKVHTSVYRYSLTERKFNKTQMPKSIVLYGTGDN